MESGRDTGWSQHLIEAAAAVAQGVSSQLYRSVDAGLVVRIAPGIFLPSEVWQALDPDDRFRARIAAAACRFGGDEPFSHLSAAVLWGVPNLTAWPTRVEVLAERARGGRSRRGIVRHGVGVPTDCEIIDGYRVTSLVRTVVDASTSLSFAGGVAMADFVLRASDPTERGVAAARASRTELHHELDQREAPRGSARARRAIEFADGRSGPPASR